MGRRGDIVRSYMSAYGGGDHAGVAALLAEEVSWVVYGHTTFTGREAYLAEMRRAEEGGLPTVIADRYLEEGDAVFASGRVRAPLPGGGEVDLVFADVFTFEGDLIVRVESYLVPAG